MSVVVITPPERMVTAAQIRTNLRLGADVADDFLEAMIDAAQGAIDGPSGWLGRAIKPQTLEYRCGTFDDVVTLPCPPVIAIDEIAYRDAAGVEHVVPADDYRIVAGSGLVAAYGKAWPFGGLAADSIRIRYQAGYDGVPGPQGGTGNVPAPLLFAVALGVRELMTTVAQDPALRTEVVDGLGQRQWTISADTTKPLTLAAERLLAPYRVFAL